MSKEINAIPTSTFAKGGKATLKKYGKKHFVELAKKRWAKQRAAEKKAKRKR